MTEAGVLDFEEAVAFLASLSGERVRVARQDIASGRSVERPLTGTLLSPTDTALHQTSLEIGLIEHNAPLHLARDAFRHGYLAGSSLTVQFGDEVITIRPVRRSDEASRIQAPRTTKTSRRRASAAVAVGAWSAHQKTLQDAGARRLATLREHEQSVDDLFSCAQEALADGVPMTLIARWGGVSRQWLYKMPSFRDRRGRTDVTREPPE
jgi:hypothetical protein